MKKTHGNQAKCLFGNHQRVCEEERHKCNRKRLISLFKSHGAIHLPIMYAGGNPLFPPFNIVAGPPAVIAPAKTGPFQPLVFPAKEAAAY
jgi:hypothetical protein